jgi:hypothetical protein
VTISLISSRKQRQDAARDWPQKRSILVLVEEAAVDEGKSVLTRLKQAIPYRIPTAPSHHQGGLAAIMDSFKKW